MVALSRTVYRCSSVIADPTMLSKRSHSARTSRWRCSGEVLARWMKKKDVSVLEPIRVLVPCLAAGPFALWKARLARKMILDVICRQETVSAGPHRIY